MTMRTCCLNMTSGHPSLPLDYQLLNFDAEIVQQSL